MKDPLSDALANSKVDKGVLMTQDRPGRKSILHRISAGDAGGCAVYCQNCQGVEWVERGNGVVRQVVDLLRMPMASTGEDIMIIDCPSCQHRFKVPGARLAGKRIRCPLCRFGLIAETPREQASDFPTEPAVRLRLEKYLKKKTTQLDLSSLGLTRLPEGVCRLSDIEELNLAGNELKSLPDSLRRLDSLKKLDLSKNRFSSFPKIVARLTRLEDLNLSRNLITSLPKRVVHLTKLRSLNLSHNNLLDWPANVERLGNLQAFYIADNRLTALPETLGHLWKLGAFDISHNQLTTLPESIGRLQHLTSLVLDGNSGLGIPTEILNSSSNPRAILGYYFQTRTQGHRPLMEAKLLVVGRGSAGKTSLVNRLVHGTFNNPEPKTDGIDITEWDLKLNDRESARLHVWDFGGQEIMHGTHRFFLTERSLYLVVLYARGGGEDADAEYWLEFVKTLGGSSPTIVVLNKTSEYPFELNQHGLKAKFPFIRDFVRTDCQTKTGLESLHGIVRVHVDALEHLRVGFPTKWSRVKDSLPGLMLENYITYEKYQELCIANGIVVAKEQEDLANYLHVLGIALNYKDDPYLRETRILNPHWVTRGVYGILTSNELIEARGELHRQDLDRFLDRKKYPARMDSFLLGLMRKFELCFPFPDEPDNRYLVPEQLTKEEPDLEGQFLEEESLLFEYRYEHLPEGLLPRFIVRTYVMSEGHPRWRSGVVLFFDGCKALVKGDVTGKKVTIRVQGPDASRSRLLAVIRSHLENIHYGMRGQEPKEFVPVPERPGLAIEYQELRMLEDKGRRVVERYHESKLVEIKVGDMLGDIDLPGKLFPFVKARKKSYERVHEEKPPVFICYAHEDEHHKELLRQHLMILERGGKISIWHDGLLGLDEKWDSRLERQLEEAGVVVLLLGPALFASKYAWAKVIPRTIARHKAAEVVALFVLVRDCHWRGSPANDQRILPINGKPIQNWGDERDTAWREVTETVERAAAEVAAKRLLDSGKERAVWTCDGRHDRDVARFVLSGDAYVEEVVSKATAELKRTTRYSSFPLALSENDPEITKGAVEAIYLHLKNDRSLRYATERDFNAATGEQRIRLPGQTGATHGTCIDLVLLFLSCLANAKLCPIFIHFRGSEYHHCLAGIWLSRPASDRPSMMTLSLLREDILSKNLLVVECTGFVEGYTQREFKLSFDEACAQARNQVEQASADEFAFSLDIERAWEDGVIPLFWS